MSLHRIGYLVIPLAVFGTASIASAQSTTTTTTIEKRVPAGLTQQQRTVIYSHLSHCDARAHDARAANCTTRQY
jgi:hypothetical protein